MEEKRFTLRMNGELFDEISELSREHRRSVAKEIELAVANYIGLIREMGYLAWADGHPEISEDKHREEVSKIHRKYSLDK